MASRYWVGGTAAWDGTAGTKWALTSGGAGGQAIPTSADDVFFDAASGAVTCTISTGNTGAKSITCTGFTGTLAGTAAISVSGSVTLVAGMTLTYTGTLSIIATGTITSAGKTLGGVTADATGGTVTLGSALTLGSTRNFTLTNGTLSLNGFTLTVGNRFSSNNSNTRAIAFGAANIVVTSTLAAILFLDIADATNFTWTGTGGFTRNQASTATATVGTTGGSVTNAPNLAITAGASALTITANSWFKNFIFTGATCSITSTNVNIAGDITIPSGVNVGPCSITFRASGTATTNIKSFANITLDGSGAVVTCADGLSANTALTLVDGTLRLKNGATSDFGSIVTTGTTLKYLESSTAGSQATISDTAGTNTVTYLSIKDSNATGGAVFNALSTTNVNAGNNTGWSFSAASGNFFMVF